jgi:hypothetical protein
MASMVNNYLRFSIVWLMFVACSGVLDMRTGLTVTAPWMEVGHATINDHSWTTVSSINTDFAKAIIFFSLADGVSAEFITTAVAVTISGKAAFKVKYSQENASSTYCPTWQTQPSPTNDQITYLIVEEGAYNISGAVFLANTGPIARQYADPISSQYRFNYVTGCPGGSCRFNDLNNVGAVSQLQTFVNARITVTRVVRTARAFATLLLQTHDSNDPANLVLAFEETLGLLAFKFGAPLYCNGGLTLALNKFSQVTSTPTFVSYGFSFESTPAVFGAVSAVGVSDFVALASFGQTNAGASLVAREDQCADTETLHSNEEDVYMISVGEKYSDPSLRQECMVSYVSTLSVAPTSAPTISPTIKPSAKPTAFPTVQPTPAPTRVPTTAPTNAPSCAPTVTPTAIPTSLPTLAPTAVPTDAPTAIPTTAPTRTPTLFPTGGPTQIPTVLPTSVPSNAPTAVPTDAPTAIPTTAPTRTPTLFPTGGPTQIPTVLPTSVPSNTPTTAPTDAPTAAPTTAPTDVPTALPTFSPTVAPTVSPTDVPTASPTFSPTNTPSSLPSSIPSSTPTRSNTSEYYYNFDSSVLFGESPFQGQNALTPDLTFNFYANQKSDLTSAKQQWVTFLSRHAKVPFPNEFYRMVVWSSWLEFGASNVQETTYECGDVKTVDSLIDALGYSTVKNSSSSQRTLSGQCAGRSYAVSNGVLCSGCTLQSLASCPEPNDKKVTIVSLPDCFTASTPMRKHAVVVGIWQRESVLDSVPIETTVEVTPDKTSVAIAADVITTDMGGSLCCKTFKSSSLVPSVAGVIYEGTCTPVERTSSGNGGHVAVALSIGNLLSMTSYDVYCTTADAVGNRAALETMVALKRTVTTLCCRQVTFSSTHAIVDSTTYYKSVFKVQVSVLPESYLTIRPVFTDTEGNLLASVESMPTSYTFTRDNYARGSERSFIFKPLQDGIIVRVNIVLTGDDASKYDAPRTHTFQSTGPNSILPAPTFTSVKFSNDGGSINACFGGSTDRAVGVLSYDTTSSWTCSNLFAFTGSRYTSCSWTSDSCVSMVFCGNGLCSSIADRSEVTFTGPGDFVNLQGGLLRSACAPGSATCANNIPANEQSVVVSYPTYPLQPSLSLTASEPGGQCNADLILDASGSTGSGGRPWKFVEWTVSQGGSSPVADLTAIHNILNNTKNTDIPVSIPYELLERTVYVFTLRVANFLQSVSDKPSLISIQVDAAKQSNAVSVSFQGASKSVRVFDPFETMVRYDVPDCITAKVESIKFHVYKSNVLQPDLKSVSSNPAVLRFDPYTFESGASYVVYATVTLSDGTSGSASMAVPVSRGSIHLSIKGGSRILSSAGFPLLLDASSSVVEDLHPSGSMQTAPDVDWGCVVSRSVVSSIAYGDDCSSLIQVDVSNSISALELIPVDTSTMIAGCEYTFTVSAFISSSDIVHDSVVIGVNGFNQAMSPSVHMISSFKKFNVDSILRLAAEISPPEITDDLIGVEASWKLLDASRSSIDLNAVVNTPLMKTLSSNATTIFFPLSAIPFGFSATRTYIFTLTATSTYANSDEKISTTAEISITGNSPPTSGGLIVNPTEGMAFSTEFMMRAVYWVDAIEDYPLAYEFKYSKSEGSALFTIGLESRQLYTRSRLPPGSMSRNNAIVCSVVVSDFYDASSTAETEVTVERSHVIMTPLSRLSRNLEIAVSTINMNLLVQTVNNAIASMTDVDCYYADDCESLNRNDCSATPHTCGACMDGYAGIAGDSNSLCVADTSIQGDVGDSCYADQDCVFGYCENGYCGYPTKTCPSSTDSRCSGHGTCVFTVDSSSEMLNSCTIADIDCSSSCVCDVGFHGAACSLDDDSFMNRTMAREMMCNALYHFGTIRDPSARTLSTIAASAVSVFEPNEVTTVDSISSCLAVLDLLVNITDRGYLQNDDLLKDSGFVSSHVHMATLIGKFAESLTILKRGPDAESDGVIAMMTSLTYSLSAAVSSLGNSVSGNMVAGEKTFEIVSDGLRISIQYESVDSLGGASLEPPSTPSGELYRSANPQIILPASGLKVCSGYSDEGYARFSLSEWGSNPHPSTNATFNGTSASVMSRVLRFTSMVSTGNSGSSGSSQSVEVEPYQLVMQYSVAQNWSQGLPSCGSYQDGEVVECPCTLLSHTAYTATFECNNLLDLCPATESSGRRKLRELNLWGNKQHPHHALAVAQHRRLDFDYAGEADDGSDDGSIVEYAAMFKSIGSEMANTLTSNPNEIANMRAAIPVLIMLSVMMAGMIVGTIILHRWDLYDWNYIIYVIRCLPKQKYKNPSIAGTLDLRTVFVEKSFLARKKKSTLKNVSEMRDSKRVTTATPREDASIERSKREKLNAYFDKLENSEDQRSDVEDEESFGDEFDEVSMMRESDYSPEASVISEHSMISKTSKSTARTAAPDFDLIGEMPTVDRVGIRIATFFDHALPPTSLLGQKSGLVRFVKAIFREHDWVRMFTYASIRLPRTIRLMVVCTNVLILFFADSLFFGILFPDSGLCEVYSDTTMKDCLHEPSKFQSGESLCTWDEETLECTVRPPPTTIQFYAVVAILVTCFSVLPEVFCAYVLEEFCAKEPRWSEEEERDDLNDDDSNPDPTSGVFATSNKLQKMLNLYAYYDFMTIAEEANVLVTSVRNCLKADLTACPLPWRQSRSSRISANAEAAMKMLDVYPDGTPVPLSLRQRLLFGNSRSRVEWKIKKVRAQAEMIVEDMQAFTGSMEDCKDTTLIQHFILEQLSPFRRYALKKEFFQFDYAMPEKVYGPLWVGAWTFMVFMWMFLVYWIFQWAMLNKGATISSWSGAIIFVLLQDVFVNEVMQIFIVHVMAIEAMRPQLKKIYETLNSILKEKSAGAIGDEMLEESLDRVRVVQHLSAACRAARHPSVAHLPSSQLLMRVNDYDASICRDERGTKLGWLTVAILALPTALALSHETVQESVLDVFLPTLWACFCIANSYLWDVHPMVMLTPYLLLVFYLLFRYLFLIPRRHRMAALNKKTATFATGDRTEAEDKPSSQELEHRRQLRVWQNMNRQMEFVVDENSTKDDGSAPRLSESSSNSGSGGIRAAHSPRKMTNPMHKGTQGLTHQMQNHAPLAQSQPYHQKYTHIDADDISEMTPLDEFAFFSQFPREPSPRGEIALQVHDDTTVFSEISCSKDNCSHCLEHKRHHVHSSKVDIPYEEESCCEISDIYKTDSYEVEQAPAPVDASEESCRSAPQPHSPRGARLIQSHPSDIHSALVNAPDTASSVPTEILQLHDGHKAEKLSHRDNTGGLMNKFMNKFVWNVGRVSFGMRNEDGNTSPFNMRVYEELEFGEEDSGPY